MKLSILAAVLVALPLLAAADVTVGAGSSVDLGMDCSNLAVSGTMAMRTVGFDQARDVTINPAGIVNGNSATLEVTGDWNNAGNFNAGSSAVQMVDTRAPPTASVSRDPGDG